MKLKKLNKQAGFAIGPVLVVVALIAIIGAAFTASNRGTSSNTSNESAKANAGLIAQQAASLKSGFERYVSDGVDITTIELTTTPSAGGKTALFDPVKGYAVAQQPPRQGSTGAWSIASYALPGVGTTTADLVLSLNGINKLTCSRLNNALANADASLDASTYGSLATNTVTAGAGTVNASGAMEGCVASGTDYVFYTVVRVN